MPFPKKKELMSVTIARDSCQALPLEKDENLEKSKRAPELNARNPIIIGENSKEIFGL